MLSGRFGRILVLLYKNDHGNRHMATVHGVVQQNAGGSPLLGSGQLLSTASLRELARQLGTGCPAEFLPDQVVARTPDLLAWWTSAAVRPMFFRAGSELEAVSGKRFPHPALLLVVQIAKNADIDLVIGCVDTRKARRAIVKQSGEPEAEESPPNSG